MREAHHHIGIVGAGYSGTTTFAQLVNYLREPQSTTISVIEADELGPGVAYGNGNPSCYLMNTQAYMLNVSTAKEDSFEVWVDKNFERLTKSYPGIENKPSAFHPRRLFGDYLASVWTSYIAKARDRGVRVDVYRQKATSFELNQSGQGGRLTLADAKTLALDRLVVAVGVWRSATIDHLKADAAGKNCVVVDDHIPGLELDNIPLDAHVGILGASQSALDVVGRLFSASTGAQFERDAKGELVFTPGANQRRVTLCSRSGRFPVVCPPRGDFIPITQFTPKLIEELFRARKLDLATFGAILEKEVRAAGIQVNWKDIREPFAGLTHAEANAKLLANLEEELLALRENRTEHPSIYLYRLAFTLFPLLMYISFNEVLSAAEHATARQLFDPIVRQYVGPSPPETLERVIALMKAGRLDVRMGVQAPMVDGDSFQIDHTSFAGEVGSLRVRYLVNATGILTDRKLERFDNPLVRSLFAQGILSSYRREGLDMGGVNYDPWTMRAIGPSGEVSKSVYVIGELIRGRALLANSATVLRTLGDNAARSLAAAACSDELAQQPQPQAISDIMRIGGRAPFFEHG